MLVDALHQKGCAVLKLESKGSLNPYNQRCGFAHGFRVCACTASGPLQAHRFAELCQPLAHNILPVEDDIILAKTLFAQGRADGRAYQVRQRTRPLLFTPWPRIAKAHMFLHSPVLQHAGLARPIRYMKGMIRAKATIPKMEVLEPHASLLLDWYDTHARRLPWRARAGERADPYAVFLSEIMLQQTTVEAVKAYYAAFLARWPDVKALAAAPNEDIMQAWAGLGYYARARNLHACAKLVARQFDGHFPSDEQSLRLLPGIGAYTSAAIAAIAFGHRAVVVDGNVERVVTRLFAINTPVRLAKKQVYSAASSLTPDERAGDFAQAMMDLGATICTPRRPACALCPFRGYCHAFAQGKSEAYPVKEAKAQLPLKSGAVFFAVRADGAVLVRTRPAKGLLGGMVEFPGSQWLVDFDAGQALAYAPLEADWQRLEGRVQHVFTHFSLGLTVFRASFGPNCPCPDGCRWEAEDRLDQLALPTLMRKVLKLARKGDA